MRTFYTFLFYLAFPFIFLRGYWRNRYSPESKRWPERLGFCPFQLENCIWVHAVSVGETIAAIPLIKRLREDYPTLPLVITNMTVTGAARVKAVFGEEIQQLFIPYDLPGAVNRFLHRIRPKAAIIMETELWPNLLAGCRKHHIPIIITNARLSEKSANGYKKIPSLTKQMLNGISGLSAQSHADAERFIALGLAEEKIIVTGNVKFDLEIPPQVAIQAVQIQQEWGTDRAIWVAASTHAGEEEIILQAHRMLQHHFPNIVLILVPRHPNRFDSVALLCQQQGFQVARRSDQEICDEKTDIYLADTMGELLLFYAVAQAAFIGGSFVQVGGHNMLEAAALHKPILTGPFLFNFAEISHMLLQAEGMFVVNNGEELAEWVRRLLIDSSLREKMGNHAYQVVQANRGALDKQMELIKRFI